MYFLPYAAIAAALNQVMGVWDTLSAPVRKAILAIVKNFTPSSR